VEENHRQNAALGEGLQKLLRDREGLRNVIYTLFESVFKHHRGEAA
jgi:hypothetical protein